MNPRQKRRKVPRLGEEPHSHYTKEQQREFYKDNLVWSKQHAERKELDKIKELAEDKANLARINYELEQDTLKEMQKKKNLKNEQLNEYLNYLYQNGEKNPYPYQRNEIVKEKIGNENRDIKIKNYYKENENINLNPMIDNEKYNIKELPLKSLDKNKLSYNIINGKMEDKLEDNKNKISKEREEFNEYILNKQVESIYPQQSRMYMQNNNNNNQPKMMMNPQEEALRQQQMYFNHNIPEEYIQQKNINLMKMEQQKMLSQNNNNNNKNKNIRNNPYDNVPQEVINDILKMQREKEDQKRYMIMQQKLDPYDQNRPYADYFQKREKLEQKYSFNHEFAPAVQMDQPPQIPETYDSYQQKVKRLNSTNESKMDYLINKSKFNTEKKDLIIDEPHLQIIDPNYQYNIEMQKQIEKDINAKNYFSDNKYIRQQQYKEILDSQVQTKKNNMEKLNKLMNNEIKINDYNNNNGYNAYKEMQVRNNKLSDVPGDPFKANMYSIGAHSDLPNNPITSPKEYEYSFLGRRKQQK